MTPERYRAVMADYDAQLTPDETAAGWHFCPEWDGLLIGPGMLHELESCVCAGSPRGRFVKTVAAMRAAQKEYFAKRTTDSLRAAKQLEQQVDKWLKEQETSP